MLSVSSRIPLSSRILKFLEMRRFLNLQEFQSKSLLKDYDIDVQDFKIARSIIDAKNISEQFKQKEYVIKAQILAGGRRKGTFSNGLKGGVKLIKNPKDIESIVEKMLGFRLITKQTPENGILVNTVMIAEALDLIKERYFAILIDRETSGYVIVYSNEGGVDIEEVAEKNPEKIFKEYVNFADGLSNEQLSRIAQNFGFSPNSKQFYIATDQIAKLYRFFCDLDLTQLEINPFGETKEGRLVCFDAKLVFDSSALFRHKKISSFAEENEKVEVESAGANSLVAFEAEANRVGINYIGLQNKSGNIACMVNGAGLAMATMDMIKICGGEPANFLDCGGSVTEIQITNAFRLLTSDERVKCVFVNIFGGIVNCMTVAKGLVSALEKQTLTHPLVVRLEGTNSEAARQYLTSSSLRVNVADSFEGATRLAVKHAIG